MTPQEKAEELLLKIKDNITENSPVAIHEDFEEWHDAAKECALIVVNEIIPIIESYEDALSASQKSDALDYWQEVKQEIEKL